MRLSTKSKIAITTALTAPLLLVSCNETNIIAPSMVSGSVALGPLSGGTVSVTDLHGNILGSGSTISYLENRDTSTFVDPQGDTVRYLPPRAPGMVGDFENIRITTSLADDQLVIVKVSGGKDIDPNDDGIISTPGEGSSDSAPVLEGEAVAIAAFADLKAGKVVVNALSTLAYGAVRNQLATATEDSIQSYLNRVAQIYFKGGMEQDVSGDAILDFKDLYHFNPTIHRKVGVEMVRDHDAYLATASTYEALLPDDNPLNQTFIEGLLSGLSGEATSIAVAALLGDSDADGLLNIFEDPNTNDLDGDGFVDAIDLDRENDGMLDSWETEMGLSIYINDAHYDPDGDGLSNLEEHNIGSASGSTEGQALLTNLGLTGLNATDPHNHDTDADGASDYLEYQHASGAGLVTASGQTNTWFSMQASIGYLPNPAVADMHVDSDADGISDALESNYPDALDILVDDAALDPDGDGLSNSDELLTAVTIPAGQINAGKDVYTDPSVADTDGDGISDGLEVQGYTIASGQTVYTDPTLEDSDGDTAIDSIEKIVANLDPSVINSSISEELDAAVTPEVLDGLVAWYDTSLGVFTDIAATSPASLQNDPVAVWQDQLSASNSVSNDMAQATAAYQGLYKADAFGPGKPGIEFDGINDFMSSAHEASIDLSGEVTIVVLTKRVYADQEGGPVFDIILSKSPHWTGGFGLFSRESDNTYLGIVGSSSLVGHLMTMGTPTLTVLKLSSNEQRISHYTDNQVQNENISTSANPPLSNTDPLRLMGGMGGASGRYTGDTIAFAAMYNRVLTEAEIDLLKQYYAGDWEDSFK